MTNTASIVARLFRRHEKDTLIRQGQQTVRGRSERMREEQYECYMILREFGIPMEHRKLLFDK